VGDYFGLFNRQITTDGEVMEGTDRGRLDDVKARQISTGGAAVSSSHAINGTGL